MNLVQLPSYDFVSIIYREKRVPGGTISELLIAIIGFNMLSRPIAPDLESGGVSKKTDRQRAKKKGLQTTKH